MFPNEQGNLDGLCGIYSIVNAASKFDRGKADEIFSDIIRTLEDNKKLSKAILEGVNIHELGTILSAVADKYSLYREKPFHRCPDVPLDDFWEAMQNCISNDGVVLLGLAGRYDHWTLVENISEKRINLADSDKLKYLDRSRCTTKEPTSERIHKLSPFHTYFLFKQ